MKMVRVGDHIEVQRPKYKVKKTQYLKEGIIAVVDQGEGLIGGYINDQTKAYSGNLPVIIFGDHTCRLKFVDFPFAVGADGTQIIRPKKDFNIQYLYYALHSIGLKHFGYQRHFKYLKTSKIPWKPMDEQIRIAKFLAIFDNLIENNTRREEILEEVAGSIYHEWFVQFRIPGHKGKEMAYSELGLIPRGWQIKKLGDVMELIYGKGLRKKDRAHGAFPVFGSSGVIDFHNERLVDGPGIILGRKGNPGKVHWSQTGFYPIDTTFYVSTNLSLYYVFFHLNEMQFVDTHTAVPGLSRDSAYLKDFLVPTQDCLNQFERMMAPIFALRHSLHLQNESLQEIRDLLLPRLVSGEIDVPESDIQVPNMKAHETSKYKNGQSTLVQWQDGDEENGRRK